MLPRRALPSCPAARPTLHQVLRHRRRAAAAPQLVGRRGVLLTQRAQQAQRRQAPGPAPAPELAQQQRRQQVQLLGGLLAAALHAIDGSL